MVDLDPQANATIALDTSPTTATIADVLDEPRRSVIRQAIASSAWGDDLDVLVGPERPNATTIPIPVPSG